MQKQYILIDGSGYIFRAYYALPPISRSDGLPVGAVYGFCNMLFKLLKSLKNTKQIVVVVFDKARKNFRNEIYPLYKTNRSATPEDLIPQFEYIRKVVDAFNLPIIEQDNFEADDIIATYAEIAKKNNDSVVIYSSDKDLMQLMDDKVNLYDPLKNKQLTTADIEKKFNITDPKLIPDIQALIGDTIDNIPGVKGIGPKTASELILKYGNLEELLDKARNIKQDKKREMILSGMELAIISKKLATLKKDVPVEIPLCDIENKQIDKNKLLSFLNEMEFKSLISKVNEVTDKEKIEVAENNNTPSKNEEIKPIETNSIDYKLVDNVEKLQDLVTICEKTDKISIKAICSKENNFNSILTGIGIGLKTECFYIPINHIKQIYNDNNLFSSNETVKIENQVTIDDAKTFLNKIFINEKIKKIGHNIKDDLHILENNGFTLNNIEDVEIISYILHTSKHKHDISNLVSLYFDKYITNYKDLCGVGQRQIDFNLIIPLKAMNFICERCEYIYKLYELLMPQLTENLLKIYYEIDLPLIHILTNMEKNGILIDTNKLKNLSCELDEILNTEQQKIYKITGQEFNILSPKQLGEVLFDKMKIPYPKKNQKTYSTDVDILKDLERNGFEIANHILKYREFAKLKNTYTDALPLCIDTTGRIHTNFSITNTATGRFSSNNPNLQNIPVRTDFGKKIREAFIADENKNYTLISADYSQIELRVMAILSGAIKLQQAFLQGTDIHSQTASHIFNVAINDVTPDLRRKAKAINFGIIYGMSAFGLANNLNISNTDAAFYIENYFKTYPEIKDYMEKTKSFAKNNGYVETLFKRKIFIPYINVPRMKSYAERMAINAPCQGTAADIIKTAMIKIADVIKKQNLNDKIKILLQIHDELIFEVDKNYVDKAKEIIRHEMETAVNFQIPLIVDVGTGQNWADAH